MKITKEEFADRIIESLKLNGYINCPSEIFPSQPYKPNNCLISVSLCTDCWKQAIKQGVEP